MESTHQEYVPNTQEKAQQSPLHSQLAARTEAWQLSLPWAALLSSHMHAGLWHLTAALAGRGLTGPMEEAVYCCPQAPVVLHGKEGLPGGTLRPAAQHTWSLQCFTCSCSCVPSR